MAFTAYSTVTEVEESMPTLMRAIAPNSGQFSDSTIIKRSAVERQLVHASAQLNMALTGAGVSVPLTTSNAKQWAEAVVLDYVVGWVYQDYSRAGEQGDVTGEELQKRFTTTIDHIKKDPEFWRNALAGQQDQGARTLGSAGAKGEFRDPVYKMGSDNHF